MRIIYVVIQERILKDSKGITEYFLQGAFHDYPTAMMVKEELERNYPKLAESKELHICEIPTFSTYYEMKTLYKVFKDDILKDKRRVDDLIDYSDLFYEESEED